MAEAAIINRVEKITGLQFLVGIGGLLALIALAQFVIDFWGPQPVAVDLPELEQAFDVDADAAMTRFGEKPLLVTAQVASVHEERITLQSIYIMDVQAYLRDSPLAYSEGDLVKLHCRRVEAADYLVGYKPRLIDCAQQ